MVQQVPRRAAGDQFDLQIYEDGIVLNGSNQRKMRGVEFSNEPLIVDNSRCGAPMIFLDGEPTEINDSGLLEMHGS